MFYLCCAGAESKTTQRYSSNMGLSLAGFGSGDVKVYVGEVSIGGDNYGGAGGA